MPRGSYERAKMRRNRGAEIVSFLSKHPGMPFTAKEIQEGCNFPTGEAEKSRVVAAMGHLTRSEGSGIESFTRGTWTFTGKRSQSKKADPKESATPEMLEVIGKLTDGDFVGKGDDNNVYRIQLTKL